MVIWGCGNCNGSRGQGLSVVHFDIDRNGDKCQKLSETQCIEHVSSAVDITFPLHGRSLQTSFLFGGAFLPVVPYPSAAMVVLKKVTVISRSKAMIDGIFSIWPLVVINLLFALVAGCVMWFLVSGFVSIFNHLFAVA